MEKIVSVNKGISVWFFVFYVWGKRQSKEACDFQRGTHVMAISLTISLDYLPPNLIISFLNWNYH